MNDQIESIAKALAAGGSNVFFTGAGISTESGIPDFRSKGGVWDRHRPVLFDEFMASKEARIKYWRQKSELYPDLKRAKPNTGHMAIARLHDLGLLRAVITQNIDGLHQASGLPDEKVIELHGNNRRVRCMSCNEISSLEAAHARVEAGDLAPECETCGGYLKPDTISFGQSMPVDKVEKAAALSRACNVFIIVGSTLLVQPAASIPNYARENNAFLAIVNLSETPYDNVCDARIRGEAGRTLQEIVQKI
ncbi:MAG: sigma factor regulator FecR [Desulfobacterales bacterium]|nr:sigma factor regulator FecR [Desulfobacterales bacterium]